MSIAPTGEDAPARPPGERGIGAPLPRVEDYRFLTGQGQYVDDLAPARLAHAYVLRTPHAHARIVSVDKTAALASPGVLAVLTGEDVLAEGLGGLPCMAYPGQPGSGGHRPLQPVLATGKVRHVGEAVALVVANSFNEARDAGERIEVLYDPLPAVTLADACAAGAAKVWDDANDNVAFRIERGDLAEIERAFALAAHVTKIELHHPRASANPIEPRAALAYRDELDGRYTLCSATQTPFQVREVVCAALRLPELAVRVVAIDVGGGFGMKSQIYPEEALVLWAAVKLGRPVKWRGERGECLASDLHGRHQLTAAEVALDPQGRILALRANVAIDVGAYLGTHAGVPPSNAAISYSSVYAIPLIHAAVSAVFTNTGPLGPYRGSGKPEASFVTERLIDKAARETGVDPVDMRRRNLIPASAMPYRTPGGYLYDSGDFGQVLDLALQLSDWSGFPGRRAQSERSGRRRGIGLAMHCQRAGSQSERMEIRFTRSGMVALHAATMSTGQGHETAFAQMISDWLGVPPEQVRVFQGDTDKLLYGRGTYAQRTMIAGGSALKLAAEEVLRKGRRIAGWMLEASESDIEFERGTFRVVGTDRRVSIAAVAEKSFASPGLPEPLGIGLDGVGSHAGPNTFPNGCMVCEVEVDPETGRVEVARLCAVDDAGTAINPVTLEGQLHGSVAQGLGQALLEEVVHENGSAQLITGSFLDYCMPRADDLPEILSRLAPVPTQTNPLGVKGGGEAGNVGAPPAIVNAIVDALFSWGVTDVPMPATPERIWRAMQESR